MKLHENKKEFKELIQLTADFLKIQPVYIEKDYWVTYVLKNLFNSEYSEIFNKT